MGSNLPPHRLQRMGEGQRTRFSPTRWGCIINPDQENNVLRKFERGRRTEREKKHLLGKVKKENKSEGGKSKQGEISVLSK